MVTNRQAYPNAAGMLLDSCCYVTPSYSLYVLMALLILGVQLSMETSAPIQPLSSDVIPQDSGGKQVLVHHNPNL